MAALAGWDAALYLTEGTNATTAEAMTVTTGNTYILNDITRRRWDPDVAPTFYENGVATVQNYTYDPLAGTVTFAGAATTPVTADLSYLSRVRVGCPKSTSVTTTRDTADVTCMKLTGESQAGAVLRINLLRDASGSFLDLDLDTDIFSAETIRERIRSRGTNDYMVLEIQYSTVELFIAYVVFTSSEVSAAVDGVIEQSFEWELAAIDGAGYWTETDYVADI